MSAQEKLQTDFHAADSVDQASTEVDGRGLRKVFGGATDFTDHAAVPESLRDKLVIKYEIV